MTLGLIPARAGDCLFSQISSLVIDPIQLYLAVEKPGCEGDESHLPSKVRLQVMHCDFTLLRPTSSAPVSSSPATFCLDFLRNRQGEEVAARARS